MVIYLPQQSTDEAPLLDELTPREIVAELDKHVIGQAEAKRSVAIALRNRVRRQKLEPEMAEEVMPKNILMIGPTGVGKSFLACAVGHAACRADHSVRCFRLPRLIDELTRHAVLQTKSTFLRQIAKADLLKK